MCNNNGTNPTPPFKASSSSSSPDESSEASTTNPPPPPRMSHDAVAILVAHNAAELLKGSSDCHGLVLVKLLNVLAGYAAMDWVAPLLSQLPPVLVKHLVSAESPELRAAVIRIMSILSKKEGTRAATLQALVRESALPGSGNDLLLELFADSACGSVGVIELPPLAPVSRSTLAFLVRQYLDLISNTSSSSSSSSSKSAASQQQQQNAAVVRVLADLFRAVSVVKQGKTGRKS